MNYTIVDLENDIEKIRDELRSLRANKGHDYSGTKDTLDNLREFGSFGVLVRVMDKVKRLKHFYAQGELHVKDESVEDSMRDLINYANYLLILYRQEKSGPVLTQRKSPKGDLQGHTGKPVGIFPKGIFNPAETTGDNCVQCKKGSE